MIQGLNRFMGQLSSSVETFSCVFEIMVCHYPLLSMFCIKECMLRVYVGMMDDYGFCLMVIEHIAWLHLFG